MTGPYDRTHHGPNDRPVFYYDTQRFEHVQAVVAMLWVGLSRVKKAQAATALTAVRERANHQSTCRNGHPREGNMYWVKGHKWRACRACEHDKQRAYRTRRLVSALLEAV